MPNDCPTTSVTTIGDCLRAAEIVATEFASPLSMDAVAQFIDVVTNYEVQPGDSPKDAAALGELQGVMFTIGCVLHHGGNVPSEMATVPLMAACRAASQLLISAHGFDGVKAAWPKIAEAAKQRGA